VTRPPPHRSRRAVFPHRALQADALPQSGLCAPRDPSPCRAPDEARPFDRNVAEPCDAAGPRGASPRAAAIHPREPGSPGAVEALWQAGIVALHAIVAVVPPPFGVQGPDQVPPPATTRVPTPGGDLLERVPQLLARRAALQMGRARPSGAPAPLNAAAVTAGAAPGVWPTAREHPCLLRGHLPSTRAPPWPQLLIAARGLCLLLTRGHVSSRVAAQAGLAVTAGLDPSLTPPVEGRVPRPVGQDRRAHAAWRGPGRRLDHLPSGLSHAGLPPLPHQPPPRTSLQALCPPPDPPVVPAVVNDSLEVRVDHAVRPPTLARARPLIHGVQGADVGPLAVAPAPAVRRLEGCEESRHRALPPLVFHGRSPERAALAVAVRAIAPLDACGSVARPLAWRDAVPHVLRQRLLRRVRADVIHAVRRLLPAVLPTRSKIRPLAPLGEVATPRLRWRSGRLRSPRPDGCHGGPALPVRSLVPVQAPSAGPPLPPVLGSPVSASCGLL
jgi:hypothetical protein